MSSASAPRILLSAVEIQERIAELARQIGRDHPDGVHAVAILKGAFVFLADLIRQIDVPVSLDFLAVSTYGAGSTSSGEVRLLKDLDMAIEGRDILLVEDIVDTGLTLTYLQDVLQTRGPRRLRTAALLDKPSRRRVPVAVDYVGFTIEDCFVAGYGMDYDERYRHLPYVGMVDRVTPGG